MFLGGGEETFGAGPEDQPKTVLHVSGGVQTPPLGMMQCPQLPPPPGSDVRPLQPAP